MIGCAVATTATVLHVEDVAAWTAAAVAGRAADDDAARIDLIRALEVLKCAAEALQAEVTADFDASQRAAQAAAGVARERLGQGVAAQVAFARRESPHRGQRHVGLARVLREEMPHTMAGFRAGRIGEWKATLLARETACLSRQDRATVDKELASDADRLAGMGDGELVAEATKAAYRLDNAALAARRRRAESDRRVSLRPAPDVMSQLSALLPVKDGVAVIAALHQAANSAVARGDQRGRGQIMADTLVERVTGSGAGAGADLRLTVDLVVSDRVLLGNGAEPAWLDTFGPIPADLAQEMVADAVAAGRAALRRLYSAPDGQLVAMDSRSRLFPDGLARFVRLRDRRCRTPWVRREALVDRVEVRDLRRRAHRSGPVKLGAA